jgi:hypothetical protein
MPQPTTQVLADDEHSISAFGDISPSNRYFIPIDSNISPSKRLIIRNFNNYQPSGNRYLGQSFRLGRFQPSRKKRNYTSGGGGGGPAKQSRNDDVTTTRPPLPQFDADPFL